MFLKVQFVFLCFYVSSDYFGFVFSVSFVGIGLFRQRAKRLAEKNVSELTYGAVSSET